MKYFLALALCFVFASLAAGQGYGRSRTPQRKPQRPFVNDQWMNPIQALSGLGERLPADIERILGSTIDGAIIEGGMNGFPSHGGSGTDPSGLRNGWGADPFEPINQAVSNWNSPMGNAAYPTNFQGEELIYDAATNRYVRKHQQDKETKYIMAQQGHIMPGGPFAQSSLQAEHTIVKEANHMANKAIGGISPVIGPVVNPVGHHVEKKIVGEQMHNIVKSSGIISAGKPSYLRRGPINAGVLGQTNPAIISHNIGKATLGADSMIGHNIAKSSGPAVGVGFINPNGHVAEKMSFNQMGHDIAKATRGIDIIGHGMAKSGGAAHGRPKGGNFFGMSSVGSVNGGFVGEQMHNVAKVQNHNVVKSSGIISAGKPSYLRRGPIHAGVVGHSNPAIISHNIGKATLGADSMIGHNIAKSSGPAVGVGFINPNGHVANKMSGGAMLGTPIGGSFVGMSQTGPGMFPEDPVHSVHKVSNSGIAAMGHDPVAAHIGHGIAKQVIGESANAVNIGSNGGVSAGNPVAIAATHGLAKESLHVAGKTLNIASQSNPIRPNGPIGVGNNIFGDIDPKPFHPKPFHPKPFHPKPVVKPPPKFQTGYGRTRKF